MKKVQKVKMFHVKLPAIMVMIGGNDSLHPFLMKDVYSSANFHM